MTALEDGPYAKHDLAAPILKYVGGKRQLLPEILPKLPITIAGTYHEPFVGGGAVFFELARLGRIHQARLSDTNGELIATYKAVRDHVSDVISELHKHKYESEYYYKIRALDPWKLALDPWKLSAPKLAARMIFLNKTGFNGLYRVNKSGGFNVPFGKYTNPTICNEDGLRAASSALQIAELVTTDFADIPNLGTEDAIYADSPYLPLSKTSNFTSYQEGGFDESQHRRLAETFKGWALTGTTLLSNSDTPLSRELYKDFRIHTVSANRAVNSKASKRGKVSEILVEGIYV